MIDNLLTALCLCRIRGSLRRWASRRIDAEVSAAGGVRSYGDRDRDPRLLLRPWQPDDLAEPTRLLTDPEVTRYIVLNDPFTPQDVAEVSARTLEQWEHNGFGPRVAIEKATGRWVGRIGLNEILDWPGPDKVEIGWELHREFWGRGLATEGGRATMRYGFEAVGLARIMSATMAADAASRRVMTSAACGSRASCTCQKPSWPGTPSTGCPGRPARRRPPAGTARRAEQSMGDPSTPAVDRDVRGC